MPSVESPLYISSRLMAALDLPGAGTIHVHAETRDAEGRVVYRYVVEGEDGSVVAQGDDLRSGVGVPVDYRDAVGTLLAFLSHAAEQYDHWDVDGRGDPPDGWAFGSREVCEWAYMHDSEIIDAENVMSDDGAR